MGGEGKGGKGSETVGLDSDGKFSNYWDEQRCLGDHSPLSSNNRE